VPDEPSLEATQRLLRNLQGMEMSDPALVRRLRLPVENDHVLDSFGEAPRRKMGRAWVPLVQDLANYSFPAPPAEGPVLVFGVGLGEAVLEAVERYPESEIIAWDRDPWIVLLALSRRDFTGAIASGRLRFLLGADLVELQGQLPDATICHPILTTVYERELHFVQQSPDLPRALICEGELFLDDLDELIREQGHSTWTWEISRLAADELSVAVERLQPAFVAGINFRDGLCEACRDFGLPLALWEVDPRLRRPRPVQGTTDHTHLFTYRKAHVRWYQEAGFEHVSYLPLAANLQRRHPVSIAPEEQERLGGAVCFVGNSTMGRVEQAKGDFLRAWSGRFGPGEGGRELLGSLLQAQVQSGSRFVAAELLDEAQPGWRKQEIGAGEPDPAIWVGEVATAARRINTICNLGPLGVRVWGDEGWQQCESHGVRYMGRASHFEDLTSLYSNGGIHVDIGRVYQQDIVTMRVFDVLACGGFLLADPSDALLELFEPGVELETWSTLDELVEKVRWYLEHPDKAAAIGKRGRERVLRDHGLRDRLRPMLARLSGAP